MLRQLLLKELRLQRSCLFFVLAVVAVWGVLLLLPRREDVATVVRLLQFILLGASLLLIAPLFVGATMVAEERKIGTWDWQLSLPAARWVQWAVKIAVGSAIVLFLALVLQPLLDMGLAHRLGDLGGLGKELPSDLGHDQPTFLWLPLLLMAGAAFVSSFSRDSYKAFFGGWVVTPLVMACARLADPANMVFGTRFLYWDRRFLLVIALAAILVGLGWRNFRYERPGWRRLLAQALGLVLLVLLATDLFLRYQFSTQGFLTHNRKVAERVVAGKRSELGRGRTPLDWTGIEPLLVKHYPPHLSIGEEWEAEYWLREPFGRIYRLPGTNRLVVETNTFPGVRHRVEPSPGSTTSGGDSNANRLRPKSSPVPQPFVTSEFSRDANEMNYQIMELDMANGHVTTRYQVAGCVEQGLPDYSGYTVRNLFDEGYLVSNWPVPIPTNGVLWRIWARGKQVDAVRPGVAWVSDFREGSSGSVNPVSSDGKWVVDLKEGTYPSSDEWVERNPPSEETRIVRRDGSASWTIKNPDGQLVLWPGIEFRHPDAFGMTSKGLKARLPNGGCVMRVSNVSGRFLSFVRTDTIKAEGVNGVAQDTGYPDLVRICLLDLETGRESVLIELPPDHQTFAESQKLLHDWPEWIKKLDNGADIGTADSGRIARPGRFFRVYHQPFPALAWAPGEDKLAFVYDGWLRLFKIGPAAEGGSGEEAGKEPGGGSSIEFVSAGAIDVAGCGIETLAFWGDDNHTLLGWGKVGLFKINLEKATRPRPSAEPAR